MVKEFDEEESDGEDTRKEKRKKRAAKKALLGGVKEETVQGIYALLSFVAATLFLLAAFEKAGPLGNFAYGGLSKILGAGYFFLPAISIVLAISFFRSLSRELNVIRFGSASILFLALLGMIELGGSKGGILGRFVVYPFVKLLGVYASWIILVAVALSAILLLGNTRIPISMLRERLKKLFKKQGAEKDAPIKIAKEEEISAKEALKKDALEASEDAEREESKKTLRKLTREATIVQEVDEFETARFDRIGSGSLTPYSPPPLSLLERDHGKPEVGDIKANANIIKRTLQNFGITVEMDEVSIGPSVTRYALKPAEGVKLSKIIALNNDLALALAAHPIRIEAPIPGKSLVGIEIPNTTKTTVGLGTLLSSPEFQSADKPLLITLGKSITGKSHFANLGKMPHLLIAGATGSGKSVAIHAIITSLLFRNSPDELKLIMIDPKRVELTLYNSIPHLLTPVLTDAKKAILALKWAAKEMERRYNILEQESVRDIESYHTTKSEARKAKHGAENNAETEPLPYIVIVIDELADIMSTYPRELESAIVRLAQMSRAVGIHLILSTQRPSVNIITGLIKANIPARVALQVSSQIDSRTILDTTGAEKLLGAGDMLYLGGEMSKPVRLQSPFISESEVKKTVRYLAGQYKNEVPFEINFSERSGKNISFGSAFSDDNNLGDDDELYEEAREIVLSVGRASTSYLQRKLKVGYSRAARLMDMLEERGVIGPADGSKPRSVIGMEETTTEEVIDPPNE